MGYSVPTMPTHFDCWYSGNPTSNAPDATLSGQLYLNSREIFVEDVPTFPLNLQGMYIRMSLADITTWGFGNGSIMKWDLPGFGSYYYLVVWWDVMHLNFANAYVTFAVIQCNADGTHPDTSRNA